MRAGIYKKSKAFSLVELIIGLTVISLVMAAFVPAINVKTKPERSCARFGEKCSLCKANRCWLCNENCEQEQYLDIASCECTEMTAVQKKAHYQKLYRAQGSNECGTSDINWDKIYEDKKSAKTWWCILCEPCHVFNEANETCEYSSEICGNQ